VEKQAAVTMRTTAKVIATSERRWMDKGSVIGAMACVAFRVDQVVWL
jgi:hypothetical protein